MNKRRKPRILSILLLVLVVPLVACAQGAEDDWEILFDGETLNGWVAFKTPTPPQGWDVVDGNLTRVGGGGDLVSVGQYGNFELRLEWNISEGGNSGIMFRVDPAAARTFESGPEMQILDDPNHPDGRSRLTSAGANYGLHASHGGCGTAAGGMERDTPYRQWCAYRALAQWCEGRGVRAVVA